MNDEAKSQERSISEVDTVADFLEKIPPSQLTVISKMGERRSTICFPHPPSEPINTFRLFTPEIKLHCPDEACDGIRIFRITPPPPEIPYSKEQMFLNLIYVCSNCQRQQKIFSLSIKYDGNETSGQCYKLGELPEFGPPTPSRLRKLIGADGDIFFKGRRCENQGLGIGAFVYYRRVVENQKNRILDEIIKVSKKVGADDATISILNEAKGERQFSKALTLVKDAIPQTLQINGHNPLTLLHSALSDGLHTQSDEYCLKVASSVRVILVELSERLSQALKDEAELNNALCQLLNNKNKS